MGKHGFTRKFKLTAVRECGVTMAHASHAALWPGPPTRSLESRNELQILQNRTTHNDLDQPRQALPTPGQG